MSKKLLWIAASVIGLISFTGVAKAQTNINIFDLPDSACVKSPIVPFNIVNGAKSYSWDICAPDLYIPPHGQNVGKVDSVHGAMAMALVREKDVSFTFHLNNDGNIVRSRYNKGYNESPTSIKIVGRVTRPRGLTAVQDDNMNYHIFVISGSDKLNSKLTRLDFYNGVQDDPTDTADLGVIEDLNGPNQLFICKEGNKWYGFSFDQKDRLVRLDFGTNLFSTPSSFVLGNINNSFSTVSGLTGIYELGNWHLFASNYITNTITRISFGNTIENMPHVISLGSLNQTLARPIGISITKGCNAYYGYTLSYGTNSMVAMKWDNKSIADFPEVQSFGKIVGIKEPVFLTPIQNENGSLFMFCQNARDSISKMYFPPCTNSKYAHSDAKIPPAFSYDLPGIYSIYLTINAGLPDMDVSCRQIIIYPHPEMNVSNDTLLCSGDVSRLQALSLGADSIIWGPNYYIDTTKGFFVHVNPILDTFYTVTSYFSERCIVTDTINVSVSNLTSDAGPDRIIKDGSTTILGGSETSLGSQYTYLWVPEIGITESTATPITEAKPPYDITYYLYVSNSDGCTVVDTVNVKVPCDDVHLPNVFTPGSSSNKTNQFGLLNQQFVKINYFRIFNRWGVEVFSTSDPNGKWDGNYMGKPAPMGVYVWEVDANCANTAQRYRRSGSVTLLR